MDVVDLLPAVERLEDDVDDLEEALQKLLGSSLEETSRKLPLLDRAKLHVLVTYTLESLLHSYLRLHGVKATEHPVYTELTRLKQYYAKIAELEKGPEKRTMSLDQGAARRFISHGLAGNDKFDAARAEKEAKEKARAQLKAALMAKKKQGNTESPGPAAVSQDANDTLQPTSRPEPSSDSDTSSDSESADEIKDEGVAGDETSEFKNSSEYIELPADEPTTRETAKSKARKRKGEVLSKRAEKKARGEEKQISKQHQKDARKERRLKKKALKKKKRKENITVKAN